jgi:penicillin-binding protein 1A
MSTGAGSIEPLSEGARPRRPLCFQDRYGKKSISGDDRYGNAASSHNDSMPLEEFPDHLIKAVLATEDRRFYEHFGIDIIGTFRAHRHQCAQAGGVVQGGSTLTQQLAKNLFLNNERTIERKIKEAFLAALAGNAPDQERDSQALSRPRLYGRRHLRRRGGGAEFYFGKSVRDVTLAEAAMLAGLFKAPTKYAPHINLPAARARANDVLDNLVEAGFMTEGQVFGARRNPGHAGRPQGRRTVPNYYLDYAFDEMKQARGGDLPKSYVDRVLTCAPRLDLTVQKRGRRNHREPSSPVWPRLWRQQAAAVVMDRRRHRARHRRRPRLRRQPVQPRHRGDAPARLLVQALCLCHRDAGGADQCRSVVVDRPVCLGNWCPQNYGRSYSGSTTLTSALTALDQFHPVILTISDGRQSGDSRIGRQKIVETAREMGITRRSPIPRRCRSARRRSRVVEHHRPPTPPSPQGRPQRAAACRSRDPQLLAGELVWRCRPRRPPPVQACSGAGGGRHERR